MAHIHNVVFGKEEAMARTEYQAKTRHALDEQAILALGGEPLGQFETEDTYIWKSPDGTTCRIRNENGKYTLAEKGPDYGAHIRVKSIGGERLLAKKEAKALMEEHGILEQVLLSGQMYKLDGVIISFEHVDRLGDFVEVSGDAEADVLAMFRKLGIANDELIKESYFDLMVAKKLPHLLKKILHMRERVSQVTFGIISGIMTTIGVLVGVNATAANKRIVAGAIIAVAISDSWSDAFGMYNSKCSENCSLEHLLQGT